MKKTPGRARRRSQQGATLLVGMIMLVLVMLITITVYRLSTVHTQVVNNEQLRTEAVAAANYALDIVLNSEVDTWDTAYSGGTGTTILVNLGNIDATEDVATSSIAVTVKNLDCRRSRVIKNSELIKETGGVKYVAAEDASCFGGGGTPLTIVDPTAIGSLTDDSLCANVLYEIEAEVADAKLLNTSLSMRQGVEVRRGIDSVEDCD